MATSRLLAPRHVIASALALLSASWAFNATAADTMRCRNGRLVNVGMVDAEITALCGEPKSRTTQDVPVRNRTAAGGSVVVATTRLERWTYERGQGEFDAVLSFEDGKLVRIDLLNTR